MKKTHSLRFGVLLLQNLPYAELVERCRILESLGFDSLWIADHFVDPYVPEGFWLDGWTLLGGLAAETKTIRLGTLVSSITLRNPALLARQAATIDHLSRGRLELGVGAGRAPLDHSMTGAAPWEPPERARRFRECVEIVDRMLRNPTTTYAGKHYQIQEAVMNPLPVQRPRPPLTLAAHGPSTLRVAAALADSWNSLGKPGAPGEESAAITAERNQMLDALCADRGRDPGAIRRSLLTGFTTERPFASASSFSDSIGRYREVGIDEFIFYWLPESGHPVLHERGLTGAAITRRETLERVAVESIPAVKERDR